MSNLYLIRHGRTDANLRHLYCGSTDLPLSEQGIMELRQLHYHLPEVQFATSGMKRTNETLKILFGDVPCIEIPEFREVNFGAFEMQSYEMLKENSAYQAWLTGDNEKNIPPQGESGEQMKLRVLSALRNLQAEQKDTALITHGGVIACIMEALFPEEKKNRYQWQPEPGHGYALEASRWRAIP